MTSLYLGLLLRFSSFAFPSGTWNCDCPMNIFAQAVSVNRLVHYPGRRSYRERAMGRMCFSSQFWRANSFPSSCGLEGIDGFMVFPSCSEVSVSCRPEVIGFFSCWLSSSVVYIVDHVRNRNPTACRRLILWFNRVMAVVMGRTHSELLPCRINMCC